MTEPVIVTDNEPIDLDKRRAERAARREGQRRSPQVVNKGKTYDLPVEMPYAIVEAVGELSAAKARSDGAAAAQISTTICRALFGDRYREFLEDVPSVDDVTALLEDVVPKYGLTLGESPASG